MINRLHFSLDKWTDHSLMVRETPMPINLLIDSIKYQIRIRYLDNCTLKVVLSAELNGNKHTDRFDLYVCQSRAQFTKQCSKRLSIDKMSLEEDMYKIIEHVEEIRDSSNYY